MEEHQQLQAMMRKVEFLHEENQQLRQGMDDLKIVIGLNKNQIRALLTGELDDEPPKKPNQSLSIDYKTIRSGQQDNKSKALRFVIEEKDREIQHLLGCLEKVQKERDFAQGKALINEEISLQAERSELQLIQQLENNVQHLQGIIAQQSDKISTLEKTNNAEERGGVVIKYREVIHPNSQTILMHEEMEVYHGLTVKLQNQISYLKSVQVKLIKLLHVLLSCINDNQDIEGIATHVQSDFIQLLDTLQKANIKQSVVSPNNQMNDLNSPILSPLPNKVVVPKKRKVNLGLNHTFDMGTDEAVPKLNLDKAYQIQQINAKRSTQQAKMSEEMMMYKIKKLELELEETKKSLQREMLLAKHFEIENEEMRRHILQIESNNETLVRSNMKYGERWQRIQKGYLFYKTFFVEHKDQFHTLKNLVESEKERFEVEDSEPYGCNSERLKRETKRKRNNDLNKTMQQPFSSQQGIMDISSLIEVERVMNRKVTQTSNSNLLISDAEHDFDLGLACLDREDSYYSPNLENDWRDNIKRQWSQLANQVYNNKPRDIVQKVKTMQIKHHRTSSFQGKY